MKRHGLPVPHTVPGHRPEDTSHAPRGQGSCLVGRHQPVTHMKRFPTAPLMGWEEASSLMLESHWGVEGVMGPPYSGQLTHTQHKQNKTQQPKNNPKRNRHENNMFGLFFGICWKVKIDCGNLGWGPDPGIAGSSDWLERRTVANRGGS